ncbi:MAG: hypothetical protein ACYC6Y_14025 [Thermoguttaceae bacterium]
METSPTLRLAAAMGAAAPIDDGVIGPAILAAGVIVVLVAVAIARRAWRRRHAVRGRIEPELAIDVERLSVEAPPRSGPGLTFYNLPVRLVAIVLAPAGRAGVLPGPEGMPALLDAIVPGLAEVVAAHKPVRLLWPEQLSGSGFAHSFFIHVRLPGEGGKGTPLSSAAGIARTHLGSVMVAMVVRAERPNSYGQQILESEGDWLRAFQTRPG